MIAEISLAILAPGLLAVMLFNLNENRSASEVLGLSSGVGLSIFLPYLIFVYLFTGSIGWGRITFLTLVSLSILLLFALVKGITPSKKWFTRMDLIFFGLLALFILAVSVNFIKFPLFPRFPTQDYIEHFRIGIEYNKGTINLLGVTYPPAMQIFLGAAYDFKNVFPISAMLISSSIIAVLAAPIIHTLAYRISGNWSFAFLASGFYMFNGALWYLTIFNSGLLPNFLGNVMSLVTFLVFVEFIHKGDKKLLLLLIPTGIALLSSHITSILFIVILVGFAPFLIRSRFRHRYWLGVFALLLPIFAVVIIKFSAIPALVRFLSFVPADTSQVGSSVIGGVGDPLKIFLFQNSPFLGYLSIMLNNNLTLMFLFFTLFTQTFIFARTYYREHKSIETSSYEVESNSISDNDYAVSSTVPLWFFINLLWLLSIFLLSPSSDVAWRFAEYALVPITFLIAGGAYQLKSFAWDHSIRRKMYRKGGTKIFKTESTKKFKIIALSIIALSLFSFSFPWIMYPSLFTDISTERLIEDEIKESFEWIISSPPATSKIIAITDWRFSFLNGYGNRHVTVPISTSPIRLMPDEVHGMFSAPKIGYPVDYVIVTQGDYYIHTGDLVNLVNLFKSDSRFNEVYSNKVVHIFKPS